jgi:hypothetical protein
VGRISLPEPAISSETKRSRPGSRPGLAALGLILLALAVCWAFRRPWFQGNLDEVDAGRVIRSAQPTTRLSEWIRNYRLRSILNLRGGSPADWWYLAETQQARSSGVAFFDLPMSAVRRPSRRELLALIDTLRSCPYPLLIHCKSGADRTGLATAVYLMAVRSESPERAQWAFALKYGHIPFLGTEHLHEPLDEYAAWLASQRLPHTPERFRAWVETEYQADETAGVLQTTVPGPGARQP